EIRARGVLRAAGVLYPPLMMRKPDGTYEGADIEIMTEFAKSIGAKLEVVDAAWNVAVPGIASGKWDIIPALCITAKRQEVIDFADADLKIGGAIAVLADNPKHLLTLEDINQPSVVFANVAGGWDADFSKKVAPNAQHKLFTQFTSADLLQEVV